MHEPNPSDTYGVATVSSRVVLYLKAYGGERKGQYQDPEEKTDLERVLKQNEMDQMKDKSSFMKPEIFLGWLYFWNLLRFIG